MRASVTYNKDAIRGCLGSWMGSQTSVQICACLHTITVPGELLIREGDRAEMYLLIKGQVEIFNQTGTFHTVIEAKDASKPSTLGR